jgi:hypothetical protein
VVIPLLSKCLRMDRLFLIFKHKGNMNAFAVLFACVLFYPFARVFYTEAVSKK